MNHDYPLSTNPQPSSDFWTQGSNTIAPYTPPAPGNTAKASVPHSPIKKMHRLLRGRYPLALVLAGGGAIAGAVGGFVSLPPKFESVGQVVVNPIINTPTVGDGVIPLYPLVMQQQVGLLSGANLATEALLDKNFNDVWQKAYGSAPLPTTAEFVAATTVEHLAKNGPAITVSFDDHKKEVAEAGTHALLTAYNNQYASGDQFSDAPKKISYDEGQRADIENKIKAKRLELDDLAKKYGTTDLTTRNTAAQAALQDAEQKLATAKSNYEAAVAQLNSKTGAAPVDKEQTYSAIAATGDKNMQAYLATRETAKLNLQELGVNFGDKHPAYIRGQLRVSEAQQAVDDYANQYLRSNHGMIPMAVDTDGGANTLETLKATADRYEKLVALQRAQAVEIGTQQTRVQDAQQDISDLTRKLDTWNHDIEMLEAQLQLNKNIVVENFGSEAALAGDKRKIAAAAGFVFGGLLPLGLLMLYGISENRFRFSDDASSEDLSGCTVLGILPNLPDRLSDPQQAGVAAHCVHQIRTMLQISRSNDEPQVIAVTSASSGDGKTSLTLALGLSYAACGARTLLIDCDLVAAGLTHRLNVNSADGVLEAVANRALLEYVRTTDIADVAILPVGTTHAHHASTLSPVALRRLLSEGKKHFDIIIVDTGPILGSIEASLVCAAADRTVLAVARNQQRPLVARSITHLQSIGAQLAGVVFNRAQARDFERSMSGLALRSRPATGAGNAAAPGQATAAKAVAGSFKRAG